MARMKVNTLNAGKTLKGAVRHSGGLANSVGKGMRGLGSSMRVFKKGKR